MGVILEISAIVYMKKRLIYWQHMIEKYREVCDDYIASCGVIEGNRTLVGHNRRSQLRCKTNKQGGKKRKKNKRGKV